MTSPSHTELRFSSAQSASAAAGARLGVIGVPLPGDGPRSVRLASQGIETWCPKLERSVDNFALVDLGDLDVDVPATPERAAATPGERLVRSLRRQLVALPELPLLAIGGDPLASLPFIERAIERHATLQIIHIGAHLRLRAHADDEPYQHANVIGRVRERLGAEQRLQQWGIRAGSRAEYQLAHDDRHIERLPTFAAIAHRVSALLAAELPIYVTLHVDGLDPADVPGTRTPEPDGLRFAAVEDLLILLAREANTGPGLIGADVVGLAPELDPSGRSSVAVARLVRTLLLALVRA
jgi:agmatinase